MQSTPLRLTFLVPSEFLGSSPCNLEDLLEHALTLRILCGIRPGQWPREDPKTDAGVGIRDKDHSREQARIYTPENADSAKHSPW